MLEYLVGVEQHCCLLLTSRRPLLSSARLLAGVMSFNRGMGREASKRAGGGFSFVGGTERFLCSVEEVKPGPVPGGCDEDSLPCPVLRKWLCWRWVLAAVLHGVRVIQTSLGWEQLPISWSQDKT